jgi:hypothetical protein
LNNYVAKTIVIFKIFAAQYLTESEK